MRHLSICRHGLFKRLERKPFCYTRVHNFLWYQSIWFTAVLGGNDFLWLLLSLIVFHICVCDDKKSEILLMCSGAAIGVTGDSLLTHAGFFAFESVPGYFPVPLWLLAIWLGFCGTLRNSLKFMADRPILMTIAAGIFAPLIYSSAMRLGAVEFPLGHLITALLVSSSWILVISILLSFNIILSVNDKSIMHEEENSTLPKFNIASIANRCTKIHTGD